MLRLRFDATFNPLKAMNWIRTYISNVISELEKVNWPGRDELVSSTLIVLVATFIIAGFIFLADQMISTILEVIYQQ